MTLPLRKHDHQEDLAILENHEFCIDVLDLFQNRRAGHLSKWLYSTAQFPGDRANGAEVRKRVIEEAKNGSAYRVFNEEVAIIEKSQSAISALINEPSRLIDLGPGSLDAVKEKIFPILKNNPLIENYVGVDVCEKTLNEAVATVQGKLNVKATALNQDFVHDDFVYGQPVPAEIAVMFGQTIFNFEMDPKNAELPKQALTECLIQLRNHFSSNRKYMIVTQDIDRDSESLIAAHFAIIDYYRCLPYRMARDLNIQGRFNPDGFSVDINHFKESYAISLCLVAEESMEFSIQGEVCRISKGDRFYFHNSYKFPPHIMLDAGKAAGFDCLETIEEAENNCILHILRVV